MIRDAATALHAITVSIGRRLGIYQQLAGQGHLSVDELVRRTGTTERYLREWLHAQVSAGYLEHDPVADTYLLPDAHAPVLTDEDSPAFGAGFFPVLQHLYATEDRLVDAFQHGDGVAWHAHNPAFDSALARFFLPSYRANIVRNWLPALDGVVDTLASGGTVADIGCGEGYSTLLMAEAFPRATFHGFDYSAEPIARAKAMADERGLSGRVQFDTAMADSDTGRRYDLVTFFNCLHDMGDPVAAARQVRDSLAPGGTWMLVEPNASADLDANRHPAGRLFMSLSVVMCLPAAAAQQGPYALGNHAGEDVLEDIARQAGFTHWRRAAETPFSAVYEIRP
ncbi:class I SAM-dependent methyltransferase [Solihabitans fulvus]|nr:class I SAM-dependent methyltransferase [Solihabitans fulvus]